MKKTIADRYELTPCTAAAASIGSHERQAAVYFHDLEDENRDGDAVIFGYSLSDFDTEADLKAADASAFSTDSADLETVIF